MFILFLLSCRTHETHRILLISTYFLEFLLLELLARHDPVRPWGHRVLCMASLGFLDFTTHLPSLKRITIVWSIRSERQRKIEGYGDCPIVSALDTRWRVEANDGHWVGCGGKQAVGRRSEEERPVPPRSALLSVMLLPIVSSTYPWPLRAWRPLRAESFGC